MNKPSFPEKPVFEVEEDEKKERRLPNPRLLIIIGIVFAALLILFLLLSGGDDPKESSPAPKTPSKNENALDIENTLSEFYALANQGSLDTCNLFAEPVFAPIESQPVEPTEPGSAEPVEPGSAEPGSAEPVEPGSAEPGSAEPTESPSADPLQVCAKWLEETWTSPLDIKKTEDLQEETDEALVIYSLSNGESGGAILIEENNVWLIATLVGLRGLDLDPPEISEELVAQYDLLGEEPLYSLPVETPSNTPKETEDNNDKKTIGINCPADDQFDFTADVRDQGSFRLFANQGLASGGDIVSARHTLGSQACLSVQFKGDYRKASSLVLELSYNSWQASSASTVEFNATSGKVSINKAGQMQPIKASVLSSPDGKRLRLLFKAPPDWKNSPLPFWFLKSTFKGGTSILFDEGRPAGQTPPEGAKNLEGGWPRR